MRIFEQLKNNTGFTLVQAVFILVVLALLGVVMMRMIGVQSSTSVLALQGARAYQAARSGLEWGAARATDGYCDQDVEMKFAGIEGFTVTVSCPISPLDVNEAGSEYKVYSLTSVAKYGTYRQPDYVQRRVQMRIKLP